MSEIYKPLEYFKEGDFVEYQGNLFYQGDDIDSLIEQGFEFEEDTLEVSKNINSRRNMGLKPLEPNPYLLGTDSKGLSEVKYDTTRMLSPNLDKGILPDSDYVIVKRIKSYPPDYNFTKPDHVLWDEDTQAYYCVSNTCTDCIVEPVKVKADYIVTSTDISAQEPLCSTLVTREPEWASVFTLKNIRQNPSLVQMLDIVVEEHLTIPRTDPTYIDFLQKEYTLDKTDLYKLNYLVNEAKLSEDNFPAVEDQINLILTKFTKFKENIK